jgi:dienelactone hydrolase
MIDRGSRFLVLMLLLLTLICAAEQPPAPRIVNLTATDGIALKATYFAAGKSGPGVLLLHQCNQQRKNWDDLATRLAASGLNVLTLDYRGFGESGGTPFNQLSPQQVGQIRTEKWPGDIDAAFQYLVSQPGVKRDIIGAGGASCGVDNSIQLARRHPEVKSLVLLSGGTDRNGRQFLRGAANLPLFVSAADDDGNVVQVIEWLLSLSPNAGDKFVHYQAGGHGTELFAPHQELPGMIVDWFETTLIKTPGKAPVSSASKLPARETNILELIDQPGGASKAAQRLAEARQKDPKAVLFPEAIVNQLGYEHMQSGDTKGAVEILKLNVSAFPNSANAYDSLSDAYLADGQNDLARQNAEKALELLASDTADSEARRNLIKTSAEQKLKQLGGSAK